MEYNSSKKEKLSLKVIFLGNHTVGVRTLRVLASYANVVGVVAHPSDPEDGHAYESVFQTANKLKLPVIRASGRSDEVKSFISRFMPDIIWITDYKYILPTSILKIPRIGTINLHPSLLPKYRGRAPINWAIINGEKNLGLTAHWVDGGMDTGDIIYQYAYELSQQEDVSDALKKLYPLYEEITETIIKELASSKRINATRQNHAVSSSFPKRSPKDGKINWEQSAINIWNLVRAVAPPYPGAFGELNGGTIYIHKISSILPFGKDSYSPGSIVSGSISDSEIVISCGDGNIVVTNFDFQFNP